jgi:DeoR/GlpR family transcriptional regulator of sugar metabolism
MTPENLDESILQTINERGRIQLIDMPVILNVSQEAIENRLVKLLKKHRLEIFRLEGELLTSGYLNNVCEEINEDLQ